MTNSQDTNKKWGFLIFVVVGVVAIFTGLFAGDFLFVFSLKENTFDFNTVIQIIGPAFIASLFIERAVEVVVQTWRRFGREKIQNQLSRLNQSLEDADVEGGKDKITNDIDQANVNLIDYRRHTMEMAAGFSLFFGFLVSLIGIRLLTPFFDIDAELLKCITGLESEPEECASGIDTAKESYKWLVRYDVFITTFILAGGSAGLHSIVSAITSFAEKTKGNDPRTTSATKK